MLSLSKQEPVQNEFVALGAGIRRHRKDAMMKGYVGSLNTHFTAHQPKL